MISITFFLMTIVLISAEANRPDKEKDILKSILHNYNTGVAPANASGTAIVGHSLWIQDIIEVNTDSQYVTLLVWEILLWNDPSLAWLDSDITNMIVCADKIWKPDITLMNSVVKPDKWEEHGVSVLSNGTAVWIPVSRATAHCPMPHHIQAGDHVTCTLIYGSWLYSVDRLDMRTMNPAVDIGWFRNSNRNWGIVSASAERSQRKYDCCPQEYAAVETTIELVRKNHVD